ncbi:hypothetical protein RED65_09709 [Oceanobacter sp. RED65]|uniref:Integral membrane bound transporter domain-containing protein n=2 Tax=Bermanella marisrubri TaxID=207949 RepID=Q1N6D4_9GAMM|nr:hypothetical protein RED65_09709 [Oceanobacter sp. RED65] [Bermanella marisrubri]
MPMLIPALTVGLLAGMRKAFDIKKALGGPISLIVCISFFHWLVSYLHVLPSVLIVVVFSISTLAYYLTLKSGNLIGMLILISVALISVMGTKSLAAMTIIRNGFIEGSITALVLIPILFWLFPSNARQPQEEIYEPDNQGHHLTRAIMRSIFMLFLLAWLYTFLDTSHITLAIAAIFTLVFPCKEHQFEEAKERSIATIIGSLLMLAILGVFSHIGHFSVLLMTTLMAALYLGHKMMEGPLPPMVYQFALSVMLALLVGALNNQVPVYASILRVALTLVGTIGSVYLYALLEQLILKDNTLSPIKSKNPS